MCSWYLAAAQKDVFMMFNNKWVNEYYIPKHAKTSSGVQRLSSVKELVAFFGSQQKW